MSTLPTCEQVARARQLALTLEKEAAEHPEHFDMTWYVGSLSRNENMDVVVETAEQREAHEQGTHPKECGTVGCAIGWAPYATGVRMTLGDDWMRYAEEVLGVTPAEFDHLFMNFKPPKSGTDGALAAAARLWEWIEAHEPECEEGV